MRNAFGNFKDLLREVSYSPVMAEMLTFLDSTSALYALRREGRVSRPDENYAREIMQLFTIGMLERWFIPLLYQVFVFILFVSFY